MKIGIDARIFKYKEYSGIPKAIFEVLKRWINNTEHEYYLISNTEVCFPLELPSNWKIVIVPAFTGSGTLWQIFRLANIVRKLEIDVFWGTNFMLPAKKVRNCKYLLTIHDLAFEVMPEVVSWKTNLILRIFCKRACKQADYIHAVSESTANDIVRQYHIDKSKVKTVYWGAPVSEHISNGVDDIGKRFFLVLGTIEPRKNIETIVEAFDEFKKEDTNDIHLIFAGKWGWKFEGFKKRIEESKYKPYIHVYEYVDDDLKEKLLDSAECLLYPSLYEGFGLPILEAYQHGTQVITSYNSSIPEVGGDACLYIHSPNDYKELADCMNKVIDLSDGEKDNYKLKMEKQLLAFSWDSCASDIIEIITKE